MTCLRARALFPLILTAALAATYATLAASAGSATVHGVITVSDAATRRVANRYAGATGSPQVLQPLPAVVFLRGAGLGRPSNDGAAQRMSQRDTAFAPNLLRVRVGGSIEFRNDDPFFHNVFSYSKPKRFDLGRFPRPESKTVTFDEPGIVHVFCEIHKSMRAVVIVVDNPFHAVIGRDGRYSFENVPAGSYELVVWHVDRGTRIVRVQVPASGSVRVDATI
ncbi:MAG TPA: carboxypeptidase regulatory-like domain-containing protein [Longimicrobiales bacterium]|nr:carboxypeptidase regulatory-like domain-containing protein [Longimicrobiales bacterium]